MKKFYDKSIWHYRKNYCRKNGKNEYHPSLIVGETKKDYINIGLTSQKKRGHHSNIAIHNPTNFKEKSYLRDDILSHPKRKFSGILRNYFIHKDDYSKIDKIINKNKKRRQLGGSH